MLEDQEEKKYDVGVIPHMNELKNDMDTIQRIADSYTNSVIIKVTDDPLEVVRKIAQCCIIVSSSLHGLIVADGFGIPNVHIVITDKLGGDGFKFDDYYSGYGLKHEYVDIRKENLPSIDRIMRDYKITKEVVKEKQKMLINVFPMEAKHEVLGFIE